MEKNKDQAFVHHVNVVVDESASISQRGLTDTVIKVIDGIVETLAEGGKQWERETRVSLYTFSSAGLGQPVGHPDGDVRCLHYDKDVLRLPSLAGRYKPAGGTPLIDATIKAIDDLSQIPELYGDHAFLVYVLTDGEENTSRVHHTAMGKARALTSRIDRLPDNWTVACFVPNFQAEQNARQYGYPNVQQWDATTTQGVEEVGEVIRATTQTWMENHTKGIRGAGRSLFVGGQVDAAAVKAKLKPLAHSAYEVVVVTCREGDKSWEKRKRPTKKFPEGEIIGRVIRIDDFINRITGGKFAIGMGYYQLFSNGARRSEKIQGNKDVAVLDKKTSQLYVGPEARGIIGLPDYDVTVKADANPDYEIFVRSTSENRQLPAGTKIVLMK